MGRKKSPTSEMKPSAQAKTPLAQRLKSLITDANELKDYLGCSIQAVNQFMCGASRPSLDNLCKIAYFYNVSTDYLLGLSDIPTNKVDIESACLTTSLSKSAIEWLQRAEKEKIDILNTILEHEELAGTLLSSMYLYATSRYTNVKFQDSITDSEQSFDLSESRGILKYNAQDGFSLVLDSLRSIYAPLIDKMMEDKIALLKAQLGEE